MSDYFENAKHRSFQLAAEELEADNMRHQMEQERVQRVVGIYDKMVGSGYFDADELLAKMEFWGYECTES